ncbi:unnamed protein product, partial [Arabidopsis halleri]
NLTSVFSAGSTVLSGVSRSRRSCSSCTDVNLSYASSARSSLLSGVSRRTLSPCTATDLYTASSAMTRSLSGASRSEATSCIVGMKLWSDEPSGDNLVGVINISDVSLYFRCISFSSPRHISDSPSSVSSSRSKDAFAGPNVVFGFSNLLQRVLLILPFFAPPRKAYWFGKLDNSFRQGILPPSRIFCGSATEPLSPPFNPVTPPDLLIPQIVRSFHSQPRVRYVPPTGKTIPMLVVVSPVNRRTLCLVSMGLWRERDQTLIELGQGLDFLNLGLISPDKFIFHM